MKIILRVERVGLGQGPLHCSYCEKIAAVRIGWSYACPEHAQAISREILQALEVTA